MLKINNEIIPNKSNGGITLDSNIDELLLGIERNSDYYITNFSENYIVINDKYITVYFDPKERKISYISCSLNFKGIYEDRNTKLWTGMTVLDVLNNTKEQVAWSGFVKVNKLHGIGLPLPDDLDDFSNLDDFLDLDFAFEEIAIYLED